MSEVFRQVDFLFREKTVTLVPSLSLLRRIKAMGINHLLLAQQCLQGGADLLDLTIVHNQFLIEGGVTDVTEDESYLFMTEGNAKEFTSFQTAYVNAVMPGIDLGKKPDAPVIDRTKTKSKPKT